MVSGTSTRSPGLACAVEEVARLGLEGEPGRSGRRAPRRPRAPRAATAGTAGDADDRQREQRHLLAVREREHATGPASTPSRSAFCPNGVGTTNAPTRTPRYSRPPAHRVRRPGASSATPAAEITSIGQNAVAAKRSVPPSGKSRPEHDPAGQRGQADPERRSGGPGDRRRSASPARRASGTRPRRGWRASSHSPSTPAERTPLRARGRPRGDAERDPEQERHPPDRDVGEHAGGEQPRGDRARGGRGSGGARERREQRDGDERGDARRRGRARSRRPAARTAGVAQHVMTRRTTGRSRPSAPRARTATHDTSARPCPRSRAARSGTTTQNTRATQRRREGMLERTPHGARRVSAPWS